MHQQLTSQGQHSPSRGVLVPDSAQLGLWLFLATVTMLFAAFASAYLVRSAGPDWETTPLPAVLWLNTVVLIVSSVTLEMARSRRKKSILRTFRNWFLVTLLLGFGFLAGQLVAWKQLMDMGIFIPSNPHSSFFYILTGLHGLHLLSGLILLLYVFLRVRPALAENCNGPVHRDLTGLCATYWHFLTALWLFIFVMLFYW
jgi:cytochrome c oxidase subunit 3